MSGKANVTTAPDWLDVMTYLTELERVHKVKCSIGVQPAQRQPGAVEIVLSAVPMGGMGEALISDKATAWASSRVPRTPDAYEVSAAAYWCCHALDELLSAERWKQTTIDEHAQSA